MKLEAITSPLPRPNHPQGTLMGGWAEGAGWLGVL